ncbi:MAG: PAS domain S-box protein [Marinagarivorans sp.]
MKKSNVTKAKADSKASNYPIRLVGIGASAGGLEALRELMESLPEGAPLSYVIAQHVSPTHVSMLLSLLSPMTSLRVMDLTDNLTPEAGCVYITPPNKDVVVKNRSLCLAETRSSIGPKPSINRFFETLADEYGAHSIGIILSGTGSDGASGIRAIKAAGGITIAQEPESAKYDGMPKAAIHTGSIDFILEPKRMGSVLDRILTVPNDLAHTLEATDPTEDEYTQILNLVRQQAYFKLADYKPATIKRRIARRMSIVGASSLSDYLQHLRIHKDECNALVKDTFIGVTAFFRDAEPFTALEPIIRELARNSNDTQVIRCWVPGCSSGEEAYTIAMMIDLALTQVGKAGQQYIVFASDLDDDALERGRTALYPLSDIEAIPSIYRERYIETIGDHFRIIKRIRHHIVFTRQNVIEDPPFSRLDLISCRNLLIYFTAIVQKRVFEVFHYALNSKGWLLLGKSENAEQQAALFQSMDKQARLFRRLEGAGHYTMPIARGVPTQLQTDKQNNPQITKVAADIVSMRVLEELAERHAPPTLVIDGEDAIIHFQGNLKPFLRFPKGRVEMRFFDLVDEALRVDLRALVYSCRRDGQSVASAPRPMVINGQPTAVTATVSPLEPGSKALLMVSFEKSTQASTLEAATARVEDRDSLIVRELELELANTRAHLNVVVEELETSNEELQSLNEELQSANEELQSTNEEMQTSNEELQSTNEELLTVNEELQVKSAELEATASDLTNVKESLTFPILVVDTQLRVTQSNARCTTIIHQDGPLEGASLHSIPWRVEVPGLSTHVRRVISEDKPYKMEVRADSDQVYSLHVMPYRLDRNIIAGAVLVFEDISGRHKAEQALAESELRLRLMMSAVRDYAIIMLDPKGFVVSWNEGAQRIKGYSEEEVIGKSHSIFYSLKDQAEGKPLALLAEARDSGRAETQGWRIRKDGSRYYADVVVNSIVRNGGELIGFAKITRDITERMHAEQALRASESRFRQVTESLPQMIWTCTADGPCDYLGPQWIAYTGIPESEQLGYGWLEQIHPEDRERTIQHWQATAGKGEQFVIEFRVRRFDGEYRWFHTLALPLRNEQGKIIKWFGSNTDIDDIKRAQVQLEESKARISHIFDIMPEALLVIDEHGCIQTANKRSEDIFGYSRADFANMPVENLLPLRYRKAHAKLREHFAQMPSMRPMGAGRDLYAMHRQGYEFPVEIALVPSQQGGNNETLVSIADISARRQAEDELRLAANVFSNTLDGIMILAPDLSIIKVNSAFERVMGYSNDDIIGKPLNLLHSDRHNESFYQMIWRTVGETGGWQGEIWERHKNGKVLPLWLSISTVYTLSGVVDRYIATIYDISEQKLSQDRINYLAHYDVLTGLPNRTLFMDRLSHALSQAKRNKHALALLFIDLDNFKQVNDTLGHPTGDSLLCSVAQRLKTAVRESDTVGRLSGDEFLVMIEKTNTSTNVRKMAQKILTALSEPVSLEGGEILVSGSIGIACFPEDGEDVDTLLKHADLAMYRAKETGRNQYHFYNHEMSHLVEERHRLHNDLRHAIEQRELEIFFQPVMQIGSRRCVGAEALLRWRHHERGWISPAKFVALAEENSLIHPLGEWVFRESCRQLKAWLDAGIEIDFLSINVSGKQIMQGDFVALAQRILNETGCPPERITLELTESFLMHESNVAVARLEKLRDQGIGIAIDDFGTGYSSLSYLKRLPVTKLKLDQSFVRDLATDLNDKAIARAILKLSDAVGLTVIAEGVETEEQHDFLINEGCLLSQGFLYGRPMDSNSFARFVKEQIH